MCGRALQIPLLLRQVALHPADDRRAAAEPSMWSFLVDGGQGCNAVGGSVGAEDSVGVAVAVAVGAGSRSLAT